MTTEAAIVDSMSLDGSVINPSTDRLKVMEWAIVNAVTIPRTPKKSLAEARYGQPSSVTVLEHRREQQGAEKQDVIEAGPNMPDPGSKIFEKLPPERNRVTFELPGIVIRAEHRRMGSALLLQAKQTAVLRIKAKEKPVLNGQKLRIGRADSDKLQHRIGAVAVIVNQMAVDRDWAGDTVGADGQPGQSIGSDLLVLRLDLTPGDLAIAVGIEPNRVIEITQCDVPLSDHVIALLRKRKVAVAWLVGVSRCDA